MSLRFPKPDIGGSASLPTRTGYADICRTSGIHVDFTASADIYNVRIASLLRKPTLRSF